MAKRKSKLRRLAAKVAECNAQARRMTVEANLAQIRNGVAEIGRVRLTPEPSVHPYFYRGPRSVDDATPRKGRIADGKFKPERGQVKAHHSHVASHWDRRTGAELKHGRFDGESDAAMRHRADPNFDPEGVAERVAARKAALAKLAKKG